MAGFVPCVLHVYSVFLTQRVHVFYRSRERFLEPGSLSQNASAELREQPAEGDAEPVSHREPGKALELQDPGRQGVTGGSLCVCKGPGPRFYPLKLGYSSSFPRQKTRMYNTRERTLEGFQTPSLPEVARDAIANKEPKFSL